MMSASPEPAPKTGGEPPRARGPILRYFDGEVALVKTFWLGGGLAMALAFYGLGRALFGQDSQGVGDTVLTYALFVLLFYLWIGVYGNAEQYILPSRPRRKWFGAIWRAPSRFLSWC